jgi:hypothetical protein
MGKNFNKKTERLRLSVSVTVSWLNLVANLVPTLFLAELLLTLVGTVWATDDRSWLETWFGRVVSVPS